jgi:hypothetical protein
MIPPYPAIVPSAPYTPGPVASTATAWRVVERLAQDPIGLAWLRFLELSVLAEDDPLGHQQRLEEMVRNHSLEVDPEAPLGYVRGMKQGTATDNSGVQRAVVLWP